MTIDLERFAVTLERFAMAVEDLAESQAEILQVLGSAISSRDGELRIRVSGVIRTVSPRPEKTETFKSSEPQPVELRGKMENGWLVLTPKSGTIKPGDKNCRDNRGAQANGKI